MDINNNKTITVKITFKTTIHNNKQINHFRGHSINVEFAILL